MSAERDELLARLARRQEEAGELMGAWTSRFDLPTWIRLGAEVDALQRELRAVNALGPGFRLVEGRVMYSSRWLDAPRQGEALAHRLAVMS